MKHLVPFALFAVLARAAAASPSVEFSTPSGSIACFDFVEVRLDVRGPAPKNAAADATVTGTFGLPGEKPLAVDGFCDSPEGNVFRVRFMPSKPGNYAYTVTYRGGGVAETHEGAFVATDSRLRGPLCVDPEFTSHVQFAGTLERFFWNGIPGNGLLTCEPALMAERIDDLDRARITGLLLTVPGGEAVGNGGDSLAASGDTSVDVPAWQQIERLVLQARKRDMAVAIRFAPASGSAALIRHAVARLGAFRNIIWNVADANPSCGDASCSGQPDTLIATGDPYGHLTSIPGRRTAPSAACDQSGTRDTGPSRDDVRRAWEISLGGSYPTLDAPVSEPGAGEADAPGTLEPYAHLYDFFTGVRWWELQPSADLVVSVRSHPSASSTTVPRVFASRNPQGDLAAIYVQDGGIVTINGNLLKDQLKPLWFSPRDGGMRNAPALRPHMYRTPTAEDWVLLFRTPCNCSFRDFDNEFER